jgi:hypothetical protein
LREVRPTGLYWFLPWPIKQFLFASRENTPTDLLHLNLFSSGSDDRFSIEESNENGLMNEAINLHQSNTDLISNKALNINGEYSVPRGTKTLGISNDYLTFDK